MCGRYVSQSKVGVIEKTFQIKASDSFELEPNFNIGIGSLAPVITTEDPYKLSLLKFGLTPPWAKKQMYLFNARAEGDGNKENDPNYHGGMGILQKPAFQNAIRNKRCLVIADCFYEGSKDHGLSKPYLIYLKGRRPFAFAGVYDTWINPETKESVTGFSIITTHANKLALAIGHPRSPVILRSGEERAWLSPTTHLARITSMLHPYDSSLMNAYPISPDVKNIKNNSKNLVQPIGPRIFAENETSITYQPSRRKDHGL